MPGQCFPFKGDHGSIVIRLAVPVVPTEFVLEHLSKSISIVGHINSAPNNFTVYVSWKSIWFDLFFGGFLGFER
jgi:hypothetical protein